FDYLALERTKLAIAKGRLKRKQQVGHGERTVSIGPTKKRTKRRFCGTETLFQAQPAGKGLERGADRVAAFDRAAHNPQPFHDPVHLGVDVTDEIRAGKNWQGVVAALSLGRISSVTSTPR